MSEPPYAIRGFLRAYARALLSPATYDPGANAGLWLGLVLALPIPVMAIALSAPPYAVLASLVAPLGWGVIVGAAYQVGTIREDASRRLRLEALTDARVQEKAYTRLRSEADFERTQHERLARSLSLADAELALAEIVHESLISPDIDHGDVAVRIRHIPHAYVGGDYVQAARPRPDLLYLCVADVAGHGVAAALVVSRLHGLVQRLILEDAGPKAFLVALESAALDLLAHTALFVTFAVFRIDLASRRIEYGTAGHPAQFLLHANSLVDELYTRNTALGLQLPLARPAHRTGVAAYEPGDTLLLFTDGLYEVKESADRGQMWGEGALKALFTRVGEGDPGVVADRILDAVREYRGLRPTDDDVTLVVARLGAREGGDPMERA